MTVISLFCWNSGNATEKGQTVDLQVVNLIIWLQHRQNVSKDGDARMMRALHSRFPPCWSVSQRRRRFLLFFEERSSPPLSFSPLLKKKNSQNKRKKFHFDQEMYWCVIRLLFCLSISLFIYLFHLLSWVRFVWAHLRISMRLHVIIK